MGADAHLKTEGPDILADRGTRDLLLPIEGSEAEVFAQAFTSAGSVVPASGAAFPGTSPATPVGADAWPAQGSFVVGEMIAVKGPATPNDTLRAPQSSVGEATTLHSISLSVAPTSLEPKPNGGTRGLESDGNREGGSTGEPGRVGHASQTEGHADPPDAGHDVDHGHDVSVLQTAIAEQDAQIIVNGYPGDVVVRLDVEQGLVQDQEVDIALTTDEGGHFAILVDQDMHIGQEIEIDLDIFDEDGVLYIDLFLRDTIDIEQDTSIGLELGEGLHGGTVEVDQDIELEQNVDIDIDIEDELEERYVIKVEIGVSQEVAVTQHASVDIAISNDDIDVAVDASQTAVVDQQTTALVDFALA
ncbi:MAG TPA: hypothetical protein VGO04_32230 [Ensifer sp.]|jgi:hypothetical protein|uniref:hypothetical protein n=1 Tax=Ensifer sp. TaxID=1872086 RepID=UPI002E1516F5|nr:hypothetical protein [Ensifer sp.]